LPGANFPAVKKSDRRPPIDVASITLPGSPASFSSDNEVPHIFTWKSPVQPKEILIASAKRLLQQNLLGGDIDSLVRCKSFGSSANVDRRGDTATGRASNLSQTASASRTRFVIAFLRQHRDINSTEAGRLSLAVMPKTTRYKHKEGRHLCTRIPR
jgi:hypothetical protein